MSHVVLDLQGLSVEVVKEGRRRVLVEDLSFSVKKGECLGILGESGSGKTMAWKSFMKMTDLAAGSFLSSGQAFFKGRDLMGLSQKELRRIRGKDICMILQNPMTCFDPLCRVGHQIEESFSRHSSGTAKALRRKSIEMLELMHLTKPEEVLEKYPHQLSGGMLQRIMIGIALTAKPDLMIADEPTTAIDSLTQFEIMQEFKRIKEEFQTALIFISHDIGCVSLLADQILVLGDGITRQYGETYDVLQHPADSYTQFLIQTKRAAMNRFRQVMRTDCSEDFR